MVETSPDNVVFAIPHLKESIFKYHYEVPFTLLLELPRHCDLT